MRFTIRFRHGTDSFCPGCDSPYCTATFRDTPLLKRNRDEARALREERKAREATPDPFAGLVTEDVEAWRTQPAFEQPRETAPQCICERHAITRSLYLFRERGEAVMGSHDWSMLQAGFAKYNAVPKWERRDWLRSGEYGAKHVADWFEMTRRAEEIEASCPANVHFPTMLRDEWYGSDVETSADEARAAIDAERYETLEFRRHRAHGLPWHEGYDDDSPYARDPQLVLSKAAWDREYALPSKVTETRIETVPDSNPIYAAAGFVEDVEVERERTVMGAVHWEYKRRSEGREPWMHPSTYRWCRDLERARAKKQLQRSKIAQLIRALGGDPRKPEVASWVTERGYEAALASLEARARREGVVV